jgi:hypothetical protein
VFASQVFEAPLHILELSTLQLIKQPKEEMAKKERNKEGKKE